MQRDTPSVIPHMNEFDSLVEFTKDRLDIPGMDLIESQLRRYIQEGLTIEQIAERGNLIAIGLVNVKFRRMIDPPEQGGGRPRATDGDTQHNIHRERMVRKSACRWPRKYGLH